MAKRKWKPVTIAELAAKKVERAYYVQCGEPVNGSSGDAISSNLSGLPQIGAVYSEACHRMSSGDGSMDGATFQGK